MVREAPLPEIGAGSVLCRTIVSAISHGTEMSMWAGVSPRFTTGWDEESRLYSEAAPAKTYPVHPGYETVARVETLGPGVTLVRRGDLVWLDRPHRDWHLVPEGEASRYRLPGQMSPEQGVFVALTRVALTAVHDGTVRVGESAVVIGLGAVGLLTAQIARHAGCDPVIGIDPVPSRRRLAGRYGIRAIDLGPAEDTARAVRVMTADTGNAIAGADVVFEASGTYDGLALGTRLAARAGKIVALSSYAGQAAALSLGEEFHRNRLAIFASMSHNDCPPRGGPLWTFGRLMHTAIRLLAGGQVDGSGMITHRIPLEQAADAYQLISSDQTALKVVFTYSAPP
jgi:2-desacetyl-2-hydroxyethyl bacteriochlorophyllide A dehydrogenase